MDLAFFKGDKFTGETITHNQSCLRKGKFCLICLRRYYPNQVQRVFLSYKIVKHPNCRKNVITYNTINFIPTFLRFEIEKSFSTWGIIWMNAFPLFEWKKLFNFIDDLCLFLNLDS